MAYDCFLKLGDIKGESQDSKHKDEIQVYSFSWGASQQHTSGHGTGLGAGKVNVSDFNFVKRTDKASPVLFQKCCTGEHIKEALVTLRKAGGSQVEYLKYKFTDVLISSVQWSGSSGPAGDEVPTESVSIAFGKCEVDYQPQGKDGKPEGGSVHGGWNLSQNVKA